MSVVVHLLAILLVVAIAAFITSVALWMFIGVMAWVEDVRKHRGMGAEQFDSDYALYSAAISRHPVGRAESADTPWQCAKCKRKFKSRKGEDEPADHYARYHRSRPIGPDDWL